MLFDITVYVLTINVVWHYYVCTDQQCCLTLLPMYWPVMLFDITVYVLTSNVVW
jgi:hypothetical protein